MHSVNVIYHLLTFGPFAQLALIPSIQTIYTNTHIKHIITISLHK